LSVKNNQEHQIEYLQLAKAYILEEKIMDDGFKQALIDAMIARFKAKKNTVSYSLVWLAMNIIYNGTPE
jgi:hypothetical protein